MRIVFDTEFLEDGDTITLVSIGMVREDGATYYAVSADFDPAAANDWVREHVLPHLDDFAELGRKPVSLIAQEVLDFAGPEPEFWADHGAYDWVLLCQLYGDMSALPPGWPMWCRDVQQMAAMVGDPVLVPQLERRHHALGDAEHAALKLQVLNRRRHAASFYDPVWRRMLAADLADAVWKRVDFARRFAWLESIAELPPALGPAVTAGGRRVAWWDNKVVNVASLDGEFHCPTEVVGAALTLDFDDMRAWGLGGYRSDVVDAAAAAFVTAFWQRLGGLVGVCDASPDRDSAVMRIILRAGAGPLIDFNLPDTEIAVVLRQHDLVLTCSGGLVPHEQLAEDGESWTVEFRIETSALLFTDSASRLFACAP